MTVKNLILQWSFYLRMGFKILFFEIYTEIFTFYKKHNYSSLYVYNMC